MGLIHVFLQEENCWVDGELVKINWSDITPVTYIVFKSGFRRYYVQGKDMLPRVM